MRNQIRELADKLTFAHETIAIMEEEHRKKQEPMQASEPSASEHDADEDADKISEGSNPSAKMVDRMISNA